MRVVIDISVEDFNQKRPVLFSVFFCNQLIKYYPQVDWVFIANSNQIKSGALNNLTVIECVLMHRQSSLVRYYQRRKLSKKISRLHPQYIISPFIFIQKHFNYFLLHSNEQLHTTKQVQLKHFQYILATSFELKQSLMAKLKVSGEQIKVLPAIPRNEFKPLNDEVTGEVRNTMCGGSHFFILNSAAGSLPKIVQLLRAFSMFKKHLQSGMKLVLNLKKTKELVVLLNTYKYKNDVICIEKTNAADLSVITAASYTVIQYAQDDSFVSNGEIQCCNIPVLLLQPPSYEQQPEMYVYANEMDADDIAQKLMLLYKDETYRNKVINKASVPSDFNHSEKIISTFFSFLNH